MGSVERLGIATRGSHWQTLGYRVVGLEPRRCSDSLHGCHKFGGSDTGLLVVMGNGGWEVEALTHRGREAAKWVVLPTEHHGACWELLGTAARDVLA